MSTLKLLEQIRDQLKSIEDMPRQLTYDELYEAYMLSRYEDVVEIENNIESITKDIMGYSRSFHEEDIDNLAELTESYMEYHRDLEAIKQQGRDTIRHILNGIKLRSNNESKSN